VKYSIQFKYRCEILIPLADNDGRLFPASKIEQVGETLVGRFRGCRCQPLPPFVGSWKHRGHVYRDNLLLFTVDAPRDDETLTWMLAFKDRLKRQFNQIEIYLALSELIWL
jgi:hypothetical protein